MLHGNIPGNVCFDFEYGNEGRALEELSRCEHVVRVAIDSPRVAPTPMEPRGFLTAYDVETDSFDVYCPHQGGPALRDGLAAMLGFPAERIRVHMVDVGGAFGARSAPFPEYPLLMHVARQLRRPLKWLSTRTEDFLTDNHGRGVTLSGELGFDADGRFQVLKTEWLCDSGAYLTSAGVLTNSLNGMTIGAGVYDVPVVYGRHRQLLTNAAPTNAYRGAGRPEANYIVERLVDVAAAALRVDPLELRQRNIIGPEQMPYRTATGTVFDSGDFPGLINAVRQASDWAGFPKRRVEAAQRGRHRGIGCAVFIEPSGGGFADKDEAAIRFEPDGSVVLYTVAGPSGQGHETVFPEIVAGVLGVDAERIVLRAGDPCGPRLIDPETGAAEIVRYTSVDHIGHVITHVLADGQIMGGIMQSAGQVFGERCHYDPASGQLLAASFMDYVMPRADLVPAVDLFTHAHPTAANLLSAKGAGETGTTGALSACANGVFAALRLLGVARFDIPATPCRVWAALPR